MRGRREHLALSQADLAARAGVSRKWVYEFEAGKPTAELGLLLRVLDALELDLDVAPRSEAASTGRGDAVNLDALLAAYRVDDG